MKTDFLKLVKDQAVSSKKHAQHDLSLPHLGELRLVVETIGPNSIALMYYKKRAEEAPAEISTPFGSFKLPIKDNPIHAKVVRLNWLERALHLSLRRKVRRKLKELKDELLKYDRGYGRCKSLSHEIIGDGAV